MLVDLDDDSYIVDSKVTGFNATPSTIAQLSDWIDGIPQDDVGMPNPGITLPPRRS
jgi:hypothetical protein